jgi:hypothetical protein
MGETDMKAERVRLEKEQSKSRLVVRAAGQMGERIASLILWLGKDPVTSQGDSSSLDALGSYPTPRPYAIGP